MNWFEQLWWLIKSKLRKRTPIMLIHKGMRVETTSKYCLDTSDQRENTTAEEIYMSGTVKHISFDNNVQGWVVHFITESGDTFTALEKMVQPFVGIKFKRDKLMSNIGVDDFLKSIKGSDTDADMSSGGPEGIDELA